jgi:hypothetical protein
VVKVSTVSPQFWKYLKDLVLGAKVDLKTCTIQ